MIGMRYLENQIGIVTGSSKGIGKEVAVEFACQGAKVVVCGRDSQRTDATVGEIVATGGEAMAFVAPISSKADGDRLVSETVARFGRVDILVNNAGVVKLEPFLEHTEKTWQDHIEIHMTGALFCSQAAALAMAQKRYGRIINISTIAANMANPGFAAGIYQQRKAEQGAG